MTRCSAPIIERSLADVLQTHPDRDSLVQMVCFVEEVLVPRRSVVGAVLTGDLGLTPALELILILDGDHAEGPTAIRWLAGSDGESGFDVGLRWWAFSRLARQSWPEGVKHALSQGLLLRDTHQLLRDFFKTRLWYPDALRCHRLLDNSIRLEELLRGGALEDWVNRGELFQAHQLLSSALDRLFDHLFDFNQVWRPPLGIRLTALHRLEWLPPHLEMRLETALRTGDLGREALIGRKAAVDALFESIQERVEGEAWWPERPHEQWRATQGGI